MGVKLLVFRDTEPEIAITYERRHHSAWDLWVGTCTQCGDELAVETPEGQTWHVMDFGQRHVDRCGEERGA